MLASCNGQEEQIGEGETVFRTDAYSAGVRTDGWRLGRVAGAGRGRSWTVRGPVRGGGDVTRDVSRGE
ncbi:hypothetical protein NL676_020330 [Syzygium grande]|nr:hypothetical protein NL676_020330 [Syzygium grande]